MVKRPVAETVLLVGTFPPPIDGMSVVNVAIAAALEARGLRPAIADTSAREGSGVIYHLRRIVGHVRAVRRFLTPRGVRISTLCHGVNAGLGMVYTLPLVALARLAGLRIVLYYHSSNYLKRRSPAIGWSVRLAGRDALHVLASERMVWQFRELYAGAVRFQVIDNCAYVPEVSPPRSVLREPVRLGLLSNLRLEKGLGLAIDTVRRLRLRGVDCKLILAGPLVGEDAIRLADEARCELGPAIEFRGTVMGAAKSEFYRDIDAFLFPSLWPHETQSIVVPEAMAAGLPVIVHDHGFIRDLLAGAGVDHLILPPDGSYPERAAALIEAWRAEPRRYAAEAAACRERFLTLQARALEQFARFVIDLLPPRLRSGPSYMPYRRAALGGD